jgi:hypothetical protein
MRLREKSGTSSIGIVGALIIMVLVVILSVQIYNRFVTGGTKALQCTANGGQCTRGTCNFPNQIPALSDQAAGCKKGELCCINITRSKPIDPMCMNAEGSAALPVGTECDDNMYCDMAQVCVDRCEFCSTNINNPLYVDDIKNICGPTSLDDLKKKFSRPGRYTCSCTDAYCNLNESNCVRNFCPGTDICCVS